MSNPTTKIDCQPVNTLEELLSEFRRQHEIREEKKIQAKLLHLHNAFEIDYFGLQGMTIRILQGEYGFTEKQAQLVDAECYADNHPCFEDYLMILPGYAKFAKEIINSK